MEDLFSADGFLPRGACGDFGGGLRERLLISNTIFAFVYTIIPGVLVWWTIVRGRDQIGWWQKLTFANFIFWCGATHMTQIAVWWWPAYRFFALIHDIGAASSAFALVCLVIVLPRIMREPRPVDAIERIRLLEARDRKNCDALRRIAKRRLQEE